MASFKSVFVSELPLPRWLRHGYAIADDDPNVYILSNRISSNSPQVIAKTTQLQ